MLKKIAITGGIGSGKSMVLECAKTLGYPIFSCDEIYKKIAQSKVYIEKIKGVFPNCIIDGILDRKKLAEIVFNDNTSLETLNSIAHPMIMSRLFLEMDKIPDGLVFAEVPLLFECGYEKDFDETIYVKRNLQARINSVMERDKTDRASVLKRMQLQFNPDNENERIKLLAPNVYVLENNSTRDFVVSWLKNFISNHYL